MILLTISLYGQASEVLCYRDTSFGKYRDKADIHYHPDLHGDEYHIIAPSVLEGREISVVAIEKSHEGEVHIIPLQFELIGDGKARAWLYAGGTLMSNAEISIGYGVNCAKGFTVPISDAFEWPIEPNAGHIDSE